ncbi:hypothetical protein L6164_022675 [Bauhinia variegata]|nr:hypothetical protein L6164_022675 [Bauhinia variegata]
MGDLSKISLEALVSRFFQFIPLRFRSDSPKGSLTPLKDRLRMPEDEVQPPFRSDGPKRGLTPLKDRLRMPEDEVQPTLAETQIAAAPLTENRQVQTPSTADKYSEMKPPKIKSISFKDPSLSSKHRSSKRQEYAEFYGPSELLPPYSKSKSQKERSRHRHREKSGEVVSGSAGAEQKPVDYENPKFNYNLRTKYLPDDSFRFNSQ